MAITRDEARELVRHILAEDLLAGTPTQVLIACGEEVRIIYSSQEEVRFGLPRLQVAFHLMGGRLYRRDYSDDFEAITDPPTFVDTFSMEDNPGRKGQPPGSLPADKEHLVCQKAYDGSEEWLDKREYSNRLVCECGEVRWVKASDLFQVTHCKPCTFERRKARRREAARRRRATLRSQVAPPQEQARNDDG
jgi:hypothetical protein